VEFVRVLMTDPELILLDETAAGVNRTLLNDLLEAVRTLRDRGKTVLLVEHDMKMVMGTVRDRLRPRPRREAGRGAARPHPDRRASD
jgi:branched-chain amino acid transport system ATP-binding protein